MSSNRLPLARWGVEALAFLSYLALFGPWFVLVGFYAKASPFLWEYGKFALLALICWGLTHYLKPPQGSAASIMSGKRAILLIVAGLVLVITLFIIPMLGGKFSFAALVGYLVVGGFAWIMGAKKAFDLHTNYDLQKQLLFGTLAFAVLFFFANRAGIMNQVFRYTLPFVLFWLTATALVMGILRLFELQGGADLKRIKKWLRSYLFIIAGCLAIALFAGVIAPWLFQYVKIPLLYLWRLLSSLIIYFAMALGYVVQYAINWFMAKFTESNFRIEPPEMPSFEQNEVVNDFSPTTLNLLTGLQWVLLILVAFIIIRFLYLYLTQSQRTVRKRQQVETRESFSSADALRDWGRRQLKRIAMTLKQKAEVLNVFKKENSAVDIYHALLETAARKGTVRLPAQTAHKFQDKLLACFAPKEKETNHIFAAFVEELYAEQKVDAKKIELLRTDLANLKRQK
ncbi:MAG: hypothetical protein GX357_10270 [Firmicutes bacterium]|nr:hypothetical protein [Bacillota bacterium]